MKTFLVMSVCFFSISIIHAQNTEWIVYNHSNSGLPDNEVLSIAIDGSGARWIGTYLGLTRFDGTHWTTYNTSNSGIPPQNVYSIGIEGNVIKWIGTNNGGLAKFDGANWTTYDTTNSGLPNNFVASIVIDVNGTKWIGTWGGLARFDGTNWTTYDKSNSGLPGNNVTSIVIDASGIKWIGTDGGLAKFDGTNWTTYNTSNSGLPGNNVKSIVIDGSGIKWIGIYGGGIAKFDGTNWTTYDTTNSGLPNNRVVSIVIDVSDTKWIGTRPEWNGSTSVGGGLAKFDGTNWTTYNTSNSGLPGDYAWSIVIDGSGNKWIGTRGGGLAVYKQGGVVSVKEIPSNRVPESFSLFQNYPNPFNPSTTISFALPLRAYVTLKVFDIMGRAIATIASEELSAGTYSRQWNATNMSSGIYLYRVQAGTFVETKKLVLLR